MINLTARTFVTICLLIPGYFPFAQNFPLSDPDNAGNWILNGDFSDEFEGDSLNRSRWHLQGEFLPGCVGEACRDGIYYNGFKGRWPAQFTPNNAWVAEGKLILETRWEPDFNFLNNCDVNGTGYCYGKDLQGNPLPITTAGVNSLKQFTYGYMEIYSKAADAEITSSFWTIGSGAEIDMFEMFGKYEAANRKHKEKELKFNMIEWSTGFEPRFEAFIPLDWRVADNFHVYGFNWDETSITIYVDGKLIKKYTANDFNKGSGSEWFFTGSQRLWVDQECFPWNGLPNQADLPAKYEIEYIRIWQKSNQIEDVTAPLLSGIDTSLALNGGQVAITVSEQAKLFMVPPATDGTKSELEDADKNPTVSNEGTAIVKTHGYDPGTYILYAMDWAGNISGASEDFTIESAPDPDPVLGLDQLLTEIRIAPNPGVDFIQLTGLTDRIDSATVTDTMGQVFKIPIQDNSTLNVTDLAAGIYIIHISGHSPVKFLKK